jgi:hypothetical protein
MEISLAEERAYSLIPQVSLEIARDRIEMKKTSLVAGMFGTLISRPNPDEIQVISAESRLEPYWVVKVATRMVYDRQRTYTLPIQGAEVREVTLLGQKLTIQPQKNPSITLSGVEHCREEDQVTRYFDGISGQPADLSRYQSFAKTEITDLDHYAPEGTLVVPPQTRATVVVRKVLGEVIRPITNAQVIHEERVDVEAIELNFRPVYAFEYEWLSKKKRVIVEFDALSGDTRTGGNKWSDKVKGIVTRDLLFDVTADAVGMVVPGGSIAVKLVKAMVDRTKK